MKKALFALSVALIAAASAAPEALAAKTRTEPVGVYAVVTDGTRHYTGSTQSWEQLTGRRMNCMCRSSLC